MCNDLLVQIIIYDLSFVISDSILPPIINAFDIWNIAKKKIQSLMNLTCRTLSKKFKGKNYEEIDLASSPVLKVMANWKHNANSKISYKENRKKLFVTESLD